MHYTPTLEMITMNINLENDKSLIAIGGLEVYFMGVLLYSKEKSKLWPNTTALAVKCLHCYNDYMHGKSIVHY